MPDTWSEFLVAAARKVNSTRVSSVETLDTGTVLEELDEIMHGDKLVIRCQVPIAAPMDKEESNLGASGARIAVTAPTAGRGRGSVRGRSLQADPVGNEIVEVDDCIEVYLSLCIFSVNMNTWGVSIINHTLSMCSSIIRTSANNCFTHITSTRRKFAKTYST